jgi:hypothetical protein
MWPSAAFSSVHCTDETFFSLYSAKSLTKENRQKKTDKTHAAVRGIHDCTDEFKAVVQGDLPRKEPETPILQASALSLAAEIPEGGVVLVPRQYLYVYTYTYIIQKNVYRER